MASTQANIKIIAKDFASKVIKKIGENLDKELGKKAKNILNDLNNRFDKFFKGLTVGAAAAVAALSGIAVGLFKIAEAAGRIQATEVAFDRFFQAASKTNEELRNMASSAGEFAQQLQDATMGTLSLNKVMLMANKTFAMAGAQVGHKLPQLYRVATAAATTMGTSVESTLFALTRTVGTLYTRSATLKGVTVDLETAYRHYREEMSVTNKELSRSQKQMAVLNEILRVGQRDVEAIGDANLLLSFQAAKAKSSLIDLKNSILSELAPAFSVLLQEVNRVLDNLLPRLREFATGFLNAFYQIDEGMVSAASQMGNRAGNWAVNALSWGANIGANFAAGILEGFSQAFAFVVNAIANLIATFFAPGSPPLVAPDIDKWGMETIAEWYSAMNEYDPEFNKILDKLQQQLSAKPKRRLLEWGVNAIAEWAKGLSIFDLELLEMQVKKQLDSASGALDQLNDKLSKEQRQLFEMQVLGKDPAAIRQKLSEVKATKESVRQKEEEVARLEKRRDEIREQLGLFRKLNQIINQMSDNLAKASGAGKGAGGGLASVFEDAADFDFSGIDAGISNLEGKMSGFRKTLEDIFKEPLETITTAWNKSMGRMEEAVGNLGSALDSSGISGWLKERDGEFFNLAGKVVGAWIAFMLLKAILKPVWNVIAPLGKFIATVLVPALGGLASVLLLGVLVALSAFVGVSSLLAKKRIPELAGKMNLLETAMFGLAEACLTARMLVGILAIKFYDLATAAQEAVASALDAMANLVDGLSIPGTGSFFGEMAKNFREEAGVIREEAEETRGEIRDIVGNWVSKADWKEGFDFSEQEGALGGLQEKADEVGVKFGTYLPTILKTDFGVALDEASTNTSNFAEDVIRDMGLMGENVGNTIIPDMTSKMETGISESYLNSIGNTKEWTAGMEEELGMLSDDLVGNDSSLIPDMMKKMQDTMWEYGWDIVLDTREWGAFVYGVIDGIRAETENLLKALRKLKDWSDNNEIRIQIKSDPIPEPIIPGSLPPLAKGIKAINDQLKETRRIGGLTALTGRGATSTDNSITITEPLMNGVTFVVPNAAVGRQMAEDLMTEMNNMVSFRREPA